MLDTPPGKGAKLRPDKENPGPEPLPGKTNRRLGPGAHLSFQKFLFGTILYYLGIISSIYEHLLFVSVLQKQQTLIKQHNKKEGLALAPTCLSRSVIH